MLHHNLHEHDCNYCNGVYVGAANRNLWDLRKTQVAGWNVLDGNVCRDSSLSPCNPGLVWTSRSSYNSLLQPTRHTCSCSLWMTAQASFKTDWNILYCITLDKSLLKQYLSSLPYTVYHCFFKCHMESRNPCCAQMPCTFLILHVPPRLLLLPSGRSDEHVWSPTLTLQHKESQLTAYQFLKDLSYLRLSTTCSVICR